MSMPFPPGYSRARSEAAEQRLFQAMATVNAAASPTHGLGAKPVGLVNDGNTCFFNSTFQALAATTSLINLLSPVIFPAEEHQAAGEEVPDIHTPAHTTTGLATGSDGSYLLPKAIPSLQDSAIDPENAKLMPVTLMFERCLGRAWRAKDSAVMSTEEYKTFVANASSNLNSSSADAGTKSAASSRRNSIAERKATDAHLSISSLLKELARKYDQYDGYRQQDAHEVLRHLLDSMSMEEKDFIKKLQPPSPDRARNKRKGRGEPAGSVENDENKLIPFTDALFGGSLVSVVICESCKNVSHTYEGFLDISLSMREQAPRARKRDKFKAIASKFKPGRSHSPGSQSQHSDNLSSSVYLEGVHPDPSDTDGFTEETTRNTSDMEKSLEISGGVPLRPEGSLPLRKRSSLTSWAGKKRTPRPSTTSSVDSLHHDSQGASGIDHSIAALRASSIRSSSHYSFASAISEESSYAISPPKPSPEQAAYIRRLLNGPNLPPKDDPLERLRQGMANLSAGEDANGNAEQPHRTYVAGQDTDLMDCLKNFSAVEVLEGDNAFACNKCWQYKTGRIKRKASNRKDPGEVLLEEDEGREDSDERGGLQRSIKKSIGPSVAFSSPKSANAQVPAISVTEMKTPPIVVDHDHTVLDHHATDRIPLTATISPRPSDTVTLSSGISGYSTSEEDSSDEGQGQARISITRPPMPPRRKSTHYVLRRAFKRYMIARAPPVLVFHFKRFRPPSKSTSMYASSFASLKKSDEFISFPDLLDLSPFIAPSRSDYKVTIGPDGVGRAPYMDHPPGDMGPELTPMRYKLYGTSDKLLPGYGGCTEPLLSSSITAVVVHVGATALSGHYIAYVLVDPGVVLDINRKRLVHDVGLAHEGAEDPSGGIAAAGVANSNEAEKEDNRVWCYCSDTQIRLASVTEVMQAKAYLCFYEKCD
ncbi:hypothetical protein QFC19_000992 [Naganishia cerealis]|uniref:Uncharacterized protein n=1 Tax=Naganishia cerealis TaxID=610337 RepID=A0ACC2WJN3_9TREE|nr:hypothetical protein QFC19_000992 [Naganishia cerealis]